MKTLILKSSETYENSKWDDYKYKLDYTGSNWVDIPEEEVRKLTEACQVHNKYNYKHGRSTYYHIITECEIAPTKELLFDVLKKDLEKRILRKEAKKQSDLKRKLALEETQRKKDEEEKAAEKKLYEDLKKKYEKEIREKLS